MVPHPDIPRNEDPDAKMRTPLSHRTQRIQLRLDPPHIGTMAHDPHELDDALPSREVAVQHDSLQERQHEGNARAAGRAEDVDVVCAVEVVVCYGVAVGAGEDDGCCCCCCQ